MTQEIEGQFTGPSNPFPPAAVASFTSRGWVSIPTAASDMARTNVEEYLTTAATTAVRARSKGRCVAIVGDFGTGKTHLALEMLKIMEGLTNGKSTALYVDAPGQSFVSLYRDRFLPQLDRAELRRRVSEYYAEIVAEELAGSEITAAAVTALQNGEISAEEIVERFALAPTRLLKRLTKHLEKVTRQPQFATALTLFLRPEYESAIWQWLGTATPDPVLTERGVTKIIDTDVDALEVIGVMALLYGHRSHRFALALDELEKILVPLAEAERHDDVILGLKKLIEIFVETGALLILCGLPDYFDLLPEDAKQRITQVIRPAKLSGEDTRRYIEECQRRTFGSAKLAPFTVESAAYIASIAAGNPRRVIRLCYMLYREASSRKIKTVTRALVREIAKEQYEISSTDDIASDLVRIFDRHGWSFEREKALAKKEGGQVDFWLPYGTSGSGSGVLITESILDKAEADLLASRIKTITKAGPAESPIEIFIAVNGRVVDEASAVLSGLSVRLFEYGESDFSDVIDAALAGAYQRFQSSGEKLDLAKISERLEQLGRQMSSLHRAVSDISERLSPRELAASAESGLIRVFSSLTENISRIPSDYPLTRRLFLNMNGTLDELRSLIQRGVEVNESYRIRRALDAVEEIADAVTDFEGRIARFLRTPREDRTDFRESLGDVCRTTDRAIEETWDRTSSEVERALLGSPSASDLRLRDMFLSLPREVYEILTGPEGRLRKLSCAQVSATARLACVSAIQLVTSTGSAPNGVALRACRARFCDVRHDEHRVSPAHCCIEDHRSL